MPVYRYALYPGQQFFVKSLHVLVVSDVGLRHRHLSASDTGADVRHAVIVADFGVLVVGVGIAGLSGVPHDVLFAICIVADKGAASRSRNHLIAIERQNAEAAEGAQHFSVKARSETLSRIFHYGNAVLVGNGHDAFAVVGHTVERHRHDGLGIFARLGFSVEDSLLQ